MMDTPLREQIDIELSEHSVSATDLQLFRECIERMIDQEATKLTVAALEGVRMEKDTYPCHCGCNFGHACLCKEEKFGHDQAVTKFNAKIDAAIKQAKGESRE